MSGCVVFGFRVGVVRVCIVIVPSQQPFWRKTIRSTLSKEPLHHMRLATHMPPSSLLNRSHLQTIGTKEHIVTDTCWCWTEPEPQGAYLIMGRHLKLVPCGPDQHPQCSVPCQQVNDESLDEPPSAAESRVGPCVQAEVQEVVAALVHLACVCACWTTQTTRVLSNS